MYRLYWYRIDHYPDVGYAGATFYGYPIPSAYNKWRFGLDISHIPRWKVKRWH